MFGGLPGGSSGSGPATLVTLIVVAVITFGVFSGLTYMLFQVVP
jgi:hypothetical protein